MARPPFVVQCHRSRVPAQEVCNSRSGQNRRLVASRFIELRRKVFLEEGIHASELNLDGYDSSKLDSPQDLMSACAIY